MIVLYTGHSWYFGIFFRQRCSSVVISSAIMEYFHLTKFGFNPITARCGIQNCSIWIKQKTITSSQNYGQSIAWAFPMRSCMKILLSCYIKISLMVQITFAGLKTKYRNNYNMFYLTVHHLQSYFTNNSNNLIHYLFIDGALREFLT